MDPDSPAYRLQQAKTVIEADDDLNMTSGGFDDIAGWNAADLAREVVRLHEPDEALVERVAAAIWNTDGLARFPWDGASDLDKQALRDTARAALAALTETPDA